MKRKPLMLAAGVVLAVGLTVAIAGGLAQRGTQAAARPAPRKTIIATEEQMRNWSPIPKPWQFPPPPDPSQVYQVDPLPLGVEVKERTPQEERDLKAATAILKRLRPVPAERLRFFSWLDAEDSPAVFAGWAGYVDKVTPVPEGWIIRFRVVPLARARDGGKALINNLFHEEYLWSNGNLQFVRGYPDPILGSKPWISFSGI